MKILVLYDYPPSPAGLATQGDLLYRGLKELGVEVHGVHLESAQEKEWYYRWFAPDIAVGVGYWGYTPHLVLHPQRFGVTPIPWLVADGYVANYREILAGLPLILVTSAWVKKVYMRDGLPGDNIEVLHVGIDTDSFCPRDKNDPRIKTVRQSLGIDDDQLMLLTVGGDAASKGAQEVMQALAMHANRDIPDWKYVCKTWPQPRTDQQNLADMQLAATLGIEKNVVFATSRVSRNFMPWLVAACDIYAAPSRLEGFGMIQIEANACEKPVISIKAMGLLDTLVHGKTALLAEVAQQVMLRETILTDENGSNSAKRHVFKKPRIVDYRASVHDIADHLLTLMNDPALRHRMGRTGRKRVVENFDYRVIAKRFISIVSERLGIS